MARRLRLREMIGILVAGFTILFGTRAFLLHLAPLYLAATDVVSSSYNGQRGVRHSFR